MTREDLLRDNGLIATRLGEDIQRYCPDCRFLSWSSTRPTSPAWPTLVHSGLPPRRVTTLAALDSTRLQAALAQHFGLP